MLFIFLIPTLPLAAAQLWMPFANLGSIIQTLKKHESFNPTYTDIIPTTLGPLEYMSVAAKPYIRNITKVLLGVDSKELAETLTTDTSLKPTPRQRLTKLTTLFPLWIRNMTLLTSTPGTVYGYNRAYAPTKPVFVTELTSKETESTTLEASANMMFSTTASSSTSPPPPLPPATTTTKSTTGVSETTTTMRTATSTTTATTTTIKATTTTTKKPVTPAPTTTTSRQSPSQASTTTVPKYTLPPLIPTTNGISIRPPVVFPSNIKSKFSPKNAHKKYGTTHIPPPNSCEICKPGRPCSLRLRSFETSDQIFQYAYSHSTMLDEMLLAVLRETQGTILPPPLPWKTSVSPEVVQLAQTLMRIQRPSRSLIVGIFSGLSLLAVAALTDPRGIVVGLEYPEFISYWEKIGIQHANKLQLMNRIQVRSLENVERALQRIATTEVGAFDFVLLDDYRQVNYLDDYEHAVRLLRTGGILLITDALNGGAVLSGPDYVTQEGKAVQNMNLRIKQDSRVSATLLPFSGGTWLISKL